VDAVLAPEGTPGREENFKDKAANLKNFSARAAQTARMVAAGGSNGNKKLSEALLNSAGQVESLTPQLVNAGRIRMTYPTNKAADEHFENLRKQYADAVARTRQLCDEAIDSAAFIQQSEEMMRRCTAECEDAIARGEPQRLVDGTSQIARLANRVLMVAKQEADNSEDPKFIGNVTGAANLLQASMFCFHFKNEKVHLLKYYLIIFPHCRCDSNGTRCQNSCRQHSRSRSHQKVARLKPKAFGFCWQSQESCRWPRASSGYVRSQLK